MLLHVIYCSIAVILSLSKFHKLVWSLMHVNSVFLFFYAGLGSEINLAKYRVSFVSEHFIFCFVFQPSVDQIMII